MFIAQDLESPENHAPNEEQSPTTSSAIRKNEKALLARVWGNFDTR
jgi:hypothetical protein